MFLQVVGIHVQNYVVSPWKTVVRTVTTMKASRHITVVSQVFIIVFAQQNMCKLTARL
jgi:hypothetical protein